jgi:hypothetical protein
MRRVTRLDAVQSNNVPVKSQGSLTDEQCLRPRRRSRLRSVDRGAGDLQQLSIGPFILAPIEEGKIRNVSSQAQQAYRRRALGTDAHDVLALMQASRLEYF